MADLNNDIEKYLKGELSPADRHRLEKMALDDPFLAEALEGAEEINAEDFKGDLAQIHSALDERISQNEKNKSGWFWPMRIAAGVLLLICSTYLVYFFMDNESANDLAINKTENTVPVEEKAQPIVSDSIAPIESSKEKSTTVTQQPTEKNKDLPNAQPVPVPQKETESEINNQNKSAEPTEETEQAFEIAADEKIPTEPAAVRSEELRMITKPETAKRSKKTDAAGAAAPQRVAEVTQDKSATRIITGKVIDVEDGAPLPGVNVLVKGTTKGTMTDLEGNYQIQVDDMNQALVFSFIGLETKEENVDGRAQLDVQLDQDISELSEVVVTGYGYDDTDIFTHTLSDYVQAEPEGGFKAYKIYLEDNLHYPIQAIENQVQGKVTVRFEIDPNGTISDFQITKGIGFGCDEEAIRLIRQGPKWSSPKRGDIPVKGRVKVRMKFTLPK